MGIIDTNLSHIREVEENYRKSYGQQITLSIPSGSPTCPVGYTFNDAKQICVNSVGKTTQPTRTTTDYSIWVKPWPVTNEELEKFSIGDLKIGDIILDADIDYYDNFASAVQERVTITLSSGNFIVSKITKDPVGTKILIGCVREE